MHGCKFLLVKWMWKYRFNFNKRMHHEQTHFHRIFLKSLLILPLVFSVQMQTWPAENCKRSEQRFLWESFTTWLAEMATHVFTNILFHYSVFDVALIRLQLLWNEFLELGKLWSLIIAAENWRYKLLVLTCHCTDDAWQDQFIRLESMLVIKP